MAEVEGCRLKATKYVFFNEIFLNKIGGLTPVAWARSVATSPARLRATVAAFVMCNLQ